MTAQEFAYWLQGFSEIHGNPPTDAQWKVIQDHLALVFAKVTPQYAQLGPARAQTWCTNDQQRSALLQGVLSGQCTC